jgi:hypothetical protein
MDWDPGEAPIEFLALPGKRSTPTWKSTERACAASRGSSADRKRKGRPPPLKHCPRCASVLSWDHWNPSRTHEPSIHPSSPLVVVRGINHYAQHRSRRFPRGLPHPPRACHPGNDAALHPGRFPDLRVSRADSLSPLHNVMGICLLVLWRLRLRDLDTIPLE